MIVKFENFKKHLKNHQTINYFLFHGPNYGKVIDCANLIKNLKKVNRNFEIINLFSDEIKKESLSKIFLENSTPNIFGTRTLLCFHLNSEKISREIISNIPKEINKDLTVVIKCNQLSPRSQLRTFFENNDNSISVACFEEEEREKRSYVNDFLINEGISISESQIDLLSKNLSNQRLEIKSELEKIIILYKNTPKEKSIQNMTSFLSESHDNDDTKFIFSIASKKKHSFVKNFNKFTDYGSDSIRLVTYLLEHFFRLLVVKTKIKQGIDIRSSIKELKPPIFFKNLPEFEKQISMFTISELELIIKKLFISKKELISGKWSAWSFLMLNLLLFLNSRFSPKSF